MTIQQAFKHGYDLLKAHKNRSVYSDADILMSHVLNKPRIFLYSHPEKDITKLQFTKYYQLIKKRSRNIPLSYITNQNVFFGNNFNVNSHVLIPRPETEILVEKSIVLISKMRKKNIVIADIGTGCGNIAISIAKNCPRANIIATDISKSALNIAGQNSKSMNTGNRIIFVHGSLLSPISNKKIDLLVANLPYLKTDEMPTDSHEPKMALSAGSDGLLLYTRLIKELSQLNYQPKHICLEIGYDQCLKLKALCKRHLPDYSTSVHKDLNGFDRVLIINNYQVSNKGATTRLSCRT